MLFGSRWGVSWGKGGGGSSVCVVLGHIVGGCWGDGGPVPPFSCTCSKTNQTRSQERKTFTARKRRVLSLVDVNNLLAAKKKAGSRFCLPKSPPFGSSQNFQGHVPLLFSFFFCRVLIFFVLFSCMCHKLVQLPQAAFLFQNQSEK